MRRVYALVCQNFSPVYLTSPKLVSVYESRIEAKKDADRRNGSNLTRKTYWVESVPFATTEKPA